LGDAFEREQTITRKLPHTQQLSLLPQGLTWESQSNSVPSFVAPFLAAHFQQIPAEPVQIANLELHFDLQRLSFRNALDFLASWYGAAFHCTGQVSVMVRHSV
jgi:hypothetical protein